MNRSAAISEASEIAKTFPLIRNHTGHAVLYHFDSTLRNYIELKQGGKEQFQEIIDQNFYSPYSWAVRIFEENEIPEGTFYYKPNGDPYGFNLKIAEDYEDESLSEEQALVLVNQSINAYWTGDFDEYQLIESSFERQSNNRLDHLFIYEHSQKNIGEASIRLRLKVSGSQLSRVESFIFIPEDFLREFANMRSSNNTITIVSSLSFIAVYLLLIGIPALVILQRKGWLRYKTSLVVAGIFAFVTILININTLPLKFFGYDTATSLSQFILQQSVTMISGGIMSFILFAVSFMLAESLTRFAFPNHVQLWKTWTRDIASSKHILNNTILSYLMVPCLLAFVIVFYYFSQKYLGFWSPSEALVDPNYLATIFPWFTGLGLSLQAGFGEEMLFRAIPLSAGLLIGRRFGRPILGIAIAMVVQTVIFGSMHASYPTMPAYARVIELIVPSLIWGCVYLRMGVIFGAIAHYLYDVVLFSLPIFFSSGYGLDKSLVIIGALVPLGIVLLQRYRSGRWHDLKDAAFNQSFQPEIPVKNKAQTVEEIKPDKDTPCISNKVLGFVLLVSMIGLWVFQDNRIDIKMDSVQLDRKEAITIAKDYLINNNIQLDESYKAYARFNRGNRSDAFVWQELGEVAYKDLAGSYLLSPGWDVRFVNHEGDIDSKNEEVNLRIDLNGKVTYFDHKIPENQKGASLTKEAAKVIADREMSERFNLDPDVLKVVSAKNEKRPERLDWKFIYEADNDYAYEGMQLRSEITIDGDKVSKYMQYVLIPEEWQRMNRERSVLPNMLTRISRMIASGLLIFVFIFNGFRLLTSNEFSYKTLLIFAPISLLIVINTLNDSMLFGNLPTDQPIENMKLTIGLSSVLGAIFMSLFIGLFFATLKFMLRKSNHAISLASAMLGGLSSAALFYMITIPLETVFQDIRVTYPEFALSGYYFPFINTLNVYSGILMSIAFNLLTAKLLFDFTKGYKNSVKENLIGFLATVFLVGIMHFPISFLIGVSLLQITIISLGTFLIFKYIIRNHFMMVPFFTIGQFYINKVLAKGSFCGFDSYPNESIMLLISALIAVILLAALRSFIFEENKY